MNLFSISGIFLVSTSVVLIAILAFNSKSKIARVWMFFNASIVVWGMSAFFIGQASSAQEGLASWKWAVVGVIFISVFFFHFICLFCQIQNKRVLQFAYLQGFFFFGLNFSNLYISKVYHFRNSIYYLKSTGIFYPASIILWLSFVVLALIHLIVYLKTAKGLKRTQTLYLLVGFIVGFSGGLTNFFPVFGINVYPYGNFTVPLYCIIATYAILRYRIMDIRLAISNTTIFLVVFTLILGFPFYVYYKVNTLLALISAIVLGLSGPVIFSNLRKGAENKILEEQKRYQRVLESTLENLNRFKTADEIIHHICVILFKSIRLRSVAFYLREGDGLVIKRTNTNTESYKPEINNKELIEWLTSQNTCFLLKEFHYNNHNNKYPLIDLIPQTAEMVVPLVQEERLVGLILLGEKSDSDLYSELDFVTLNKISKEIAMATALKISNSALLDTESKRMAQENEIKRLKQHELFSKNIAHTFNNPLNMINSSLGTFDDIHELYKSKIDPEDFAALENESKSARDSHRRLCKMCDMLLKKGKRNIAKAVLQGIDSLKGTILDPNSKNGIWEDVSLGEVKLKPNIDLTEEDVRGIVKNGDFDKVWSIYHQARKGVIVLRKIKIAEILEGFDIQKKSILAEYNLKLSTDIENNCSQTEVLGDDVRIVEGLIVYLNNSSQAVSKNVDLKKVEFKVYKTADKYIRFEISDNGSGIDEMVKEGLFEVSASTKGSDGNGIGLLFVRQDVCEEMPGSRYGCFSDGRGKGAKFWLDFKILNGQVENVNNEVKI